MAAALGSALTGGASAATAGRPAASSRPSRTIRISGRLFLTLSSSKEASSRLAHREGPGLHRALQRFPHIRGPDLTVIPRSGRERLRRDRLMDLEAGALAV